MGEKCLDPIPLAQDKFFFFDFDFIRSVTSLSLNMAQNGDSCQNSGTTVPVCGRGEVYLRFYLMVLLEYKK